MFYFLIWQAFNKILLINFTELTLTRYTVLDFYPINKGNFIF